MNKNCKTDLESVISTSSSGSSSSSSSNSETSESSCSNCHGNNNRNDSIYSNSVSSSSNSINTSSSSGSSNSINTSSSSGSSNSTNTGNSSSSSSDNISVGLFTNNSSIITRNNNNAKNSDINKDKNHNKNNQNHKSISNKIIIDVAVLCQEYTEIEKMCHDHIINLDEIEITKDLFQSIFYPYHENFGINKNTICNNSFYQEYISFLPEYRSVNGKKFYLLEEIISNIENDLNISRNCFTVESLVELTNEIISINSFCNLNCCSVLSSLTWCNILEIIKNYSILNENCDCSTSSSSIHQPVIPICVISVIFKTPTPGVKNTIVRFNYRITDL